MNYTTEDLSAVSFFKYAIAEFKKSMKFYQKILRPEIYFKNFEKNILIFPDVLKFSRILLLAGINKITYEYSDFNEVLEMGLPSVKDYSVQRKQKLIK